MVWTEKGTQINTAPVRAGSPIIARNMDTVVLVLDRDEALALVHELTHAFGVEGVPTKASFDKITVVIENPQGFYPKEIDA